MNDRLENHLTAQELEIINNLDTPRKIQDYLDSVPYVGEDADRCPISVMRDNQAHCLDGGLFGAAMLRRLGFPPLVVDLIPQPGLDDDHVLAVYQVDGCWGAVAKSNFVGLRYREPIYRTLRELVMSYFEFYFNVDGVKTMLGYTPTLNLSRFDKLKWETSNQHLIVIENHFKKMRVYPVISQAMVSNLSRLDDLTYKAGTLNINWDGLYKPH